MSTILEFYVEKEKRELINTINSAKYISEEQKEAMIAELSAGLLGRAADKADKKGKAGQAYRLERGEKKAQDKAALDKNRAMAAKHGQVRQGIPPTMSQGDAQKYYNDKGRAPDGWGVKDGKVVKK